jgi:hypothetical protein
MNDTIKINLKPDVTIDQIFEIMDKLRKYDKIVIIHMREKYIDMSYASFLNIKNIEDITKYIKSCSINDKRN